MNAIAIVGEFRGCNLDIVPCGTYSIISTVMLDNQHVSTIVADNGEGWYKVFRMELVNNPSVEILG